MSTRIRLPANRAGMMQSDGLAGTGSRVAEPVQPTSGGAEAPAVEEVQATPALGERLDEPGAPQHGKVLHDRPAGERELSGELVGRERLPIGDPFENSPTSRIGQRIEKLVKVVHVR